LLVRLVHRAIIHPHAASTAVGDGYQEPLGGTAARQLVAVGLWEGGQRDAALLLRGGYLATSPAVFETFHFEVPPVSLVVRSPQYRCTAETLEDVAPFAPPTCHMAGRTIHRFV